MKDAEEAVKLKPDWGKGWSRKGAALHGLGDLVGAKDAYEAGLKVDPNNAQIQSGMKAVDDAIAREAAEDGMDADMGIGKMLNDPSIFQKLAANPKTAPFLADPAFMQSLQQLQKDPSKMSESFRDPRMMQVLAVLLGIDMQMGGPGSADQAAGEFNQQQQEPEKPLSETTKQKSEEPTPETQPEDEETRKNKELKAAADNEKELGNAAYKKRSFDEAIGHYEKAWDTYQDVSYLTNLSAAYFEKGDYAGAIKQAQRAVDEGRERYADFKIIAKALGRIGSAHQKLGDLVEAVKFYGKSLTEHRTSEILTKMKEAEHLKAEQEKQAYIDPLKAEEERERGNKLFKEGDFVGSVKAYTEAIKRDPSDPRGYGNRATAYVKLAAFPEAIKDCDSAIALDPNFVKGYIRKAACYYAMREYSKCLEMCQAATEADQKPENGNKYKAEIEQQMQRAFSTMYSQKEGENEEEVLERASRDPEVVAILQDPVMQSILSSARENPASLQEHMKNPMIAQKVQRLVAAGIIRTR